jgi:molybdenum cofactor synthesis domain-containing protein
MSNPTAAMIVIGDEILSGRTRDSNMNHLAGQLTSVGIDLKEVRMIGDESATIIAAVQALSKIYDSVFTSGGIGPTHDDITADCIAAAFNKNIDVRDDARAILATHYAKSGTELNEARLRMARIPDDATLIENPVSAAPGFKLENVHVMAGVPSVFEAMVASVLPTLTGGAPLISSTVRIDRGEGDIAGPLGQVAKDHPALLIGSYPFQKDGKYGANIVIRGVDPVEINKAVQKLEAAFP